MSANRTHWERRSSEMTELSALAGSEGYAACDEAQCRSPSAAGNPRSAECTSWERRSSEMTELPASAGSEGYAACDDEAQRRSPSAAGNPRSAECTSWERRSSGMTELSASAGSEGYAACDDEAKDMQLTTTTGVLFHCTAAAMASVSSRTGSPVKSPMA